MIYEQDELESFLKKAGWAGTQRTSLTPDASPRRYARLTKSNGQTALFMMAGTDQKTESFVFLSGLLRSLGIAAPEVYEADAPRGLVLLEDFGNEPCGALIDAGRDRALFDAQAAETIALLHKSFKPEMLGTLSVKKYDTALWCEQAQRFLNEYFPYAYHRAASEDERASFIEAWRETLTPWEKLPQSLILRDFMPDNAMALAKPVLGKSLGVLDFQDAGLGTTAYDLCSWCEEVRRPGGFARLDFVAETYVKHHSVIDKATLREAMGVFETHQHMRVLGIWVTLHREHLIPCALAGLKTLLRNEKVEPLSRWFASCKIDL